MYRTILVPVDGSKRAEAIFRHVENLARGNDATVVLLKVEEEPINLEHDEIIDIEKYRQEYRNLVRRSTTYLEALQDQLGATGIRAVPRLAYGSVVKTILTVAAETGADLIALATHGLGGLPRVSYGSVAAGVLQAADIPILLIRSCNDKK
jgi:nucleotide-binding universal stress UspA family protein